MIAYGPRCIVILIDFCNEFVIVASLNFCSYFSGEKTSTKEWPDSIEIKGRVRLDAFEKFLQELPMSRSRAVMVYQVFLLFFLITHTHACLRTLQCFEIYFLWLTRLRNEDK